MVFTEKDKAFIKNFYLIKAYALRRFMRELPEKSWKSF